MVKPEIVSIFAEKANIMENWKDIKGYEGIYQVSDEGRVRSLDREVTYFNGVKHIHKGIILKNRKFRNGYLYVCLHDGHKNWRTVHRLVYETFVGEIPEGMQVNHIDEDKTNNRLDNLNLMTPKENMNWGTRINRISKPVYGYDMDGNLVVSFPSTAEAEKHGFCKQAVGACARGAKHRNTHKGLIWKYEKMGDC